MESGYTKSSLLFLLCFLRCSLQIGDCLLLCFVELFCLWMRWLRQHRGEHPGQEERGWQGPHGREVWDRPPAKCGVGHGHGLPFSVGSGGISAPPQAQPRRLREHSGIRTQPYLSLPRGGLGSVEHLLPPLHARHGFHVLAPVTHFHGAFLREGRGRG